MKTKMNRFFLILLLVMVLTGCEQSDAFLAAEESEEAAAWPQTEVESSEESTEAYIYVYVCGKVNQPGVYQLPADSRICDALAAAGGVTAEGNAEALNQAEHMSDGQKIYVPDYEEDSSTQFVEADGLIDINSASKEELMTLPGIGESKAATILQYREEHGNFQSIEELMNIPGIKEGVFNKIKDSIKVS